MWFRVIFLGFWCLLAVVAAAWPQEDGLETASDGKAAILLSPRGSSTHNWVFSVKFVARGHRKCVPRVGGMVGWVIGLFGTCAADSEGHSGNLQQWLAVCDPLTGPMDEQVLNISLVPFHTRAWVCVGLCWLIAPFNSNWSQSGGWTPPGAPHLTFSRSVFIPIFC